MGLQARYDFAGKRPGVRLCLIHPADLRVQIVERCVEAEHCLEGLALDDAGFKDVDAVRRQLAFLQRP